MSEVDEKLVPTGKVETFEFDHLFEGKCAVKEMECVVDDVLKKKALSGNEYYLDHHVEKPKTDLPPTTPPKRDRVASPQQRSVKKRKLKKNKSSPVSHTLEEESSSDEERRFQILLTNSYRRSLKLRITFEQQERQANREQREKWEQVEFFLYVQQNVNNRFFKIPKRKEDDRVFEVRGLRNLQNMVQQNYTILEPTTSSSLKEEIDKADLAIPTWKILGDYDTIRNEEVDDSFWTRYKLGLIKGPGII